MRNTLFGILFLFILPLQAHQKLPYLQKQGSTTQLMVDGKPFLGLAVNWEILQLPLLKILNVYSRNCNVWG